MVLPFYLSVLFPCQLSAQDDFRIVHGDCTPTANALQNDAPPTTTTRKRLPAIRTEWDAEKTYKQMVILLEFSDQTFDATNMPDPKSYYQRLFNEKGYNEGNGLGCVADYFRSQSGGLLNLEFDVFGPVTVSQKAQPYGSPTADTRNYGTDSFIEATKSILASNPDWDYKQYDWNGDGTIEQVIYVYAGVSGNTGSTSYGHIWPNTSSFGNIKAPDGTRISNYTSSAEKWPTPTYRSCGIGTICHEFTHSLGLPDIYPTAKGMPYSVADEWDLMDGGNFTNYGWCPPNYTSLEKWLLGWLTPIELTDPVTITDMKSIEDGGNTYIIKHTATEYLLLENRQWQGWDAGLPGEGLVIWHVNYNKTNWRNNSVNNTLGQYGFSLVPADNMDYDQWKEHIGTGGNYQNSMRMNNRHLSTAPYPWIQDEQVKNDSLTDTSTPASIMITANGTGAKMLGKSITNIRITDNGMIAFDFMGGIPSGIWSVTDEPWATDNTPRATGIGVYDLQGRPVTPLSTSSTSRHLYIIKGADGIVRKIFK